MQSALAISHALYFKRAAFHYLLQVQSARAITTLLKHTTNRRYSSSSSNSVKGYAGVDVKRDVRYSSLHPRNVLDIYLPSNKKELRKHNTSPTLLFVHGGMWLRGSKEQNTLSIYDIASQLASQASVALWKDSLSQSNVSANDENARYETRFSNLGLCVAHHGGTACVMNYRLAGINTDETGHPHQVMDVARAIAFLVAQSVGDKLPQELYIGGHSAGAHLAALVLSDPQYLRIAMEERNLNPALISKVLKGFIGISGVYNLSRLAMSPLAAVTVGPAFQGNKDSDDTLDASPVQVLLSAQNESSLPHLATVPILLLNAESDFHLAQDTAELLTALGSFVVSKVPRRHAVVVPNRNHLSIMGEFGRGKIVKDKDNPSPESEGYSVTSVLRYSLDILSSTADYLAPYVVSSSGLDSAETDKHDETSTRLLQFMKLLT